MLIISFQGKYQSELPQKDVSRYKKFVFKLSRSMRNSILSGCGNSFGSFLIKRRYLLITSVCTVMGQMGEEVELMRITNKAFQIFERSSMKNIKHPSSRF